MGFASSHVDLERHFLKIILLYRLEILSHKLWIHFQCSEDRCSWRNVSYTNIYFQLIFRSFTSRLLSQLQRGMEDTLLHNIAVILEFLSHFALWTIVSILCFWYVHILLCFLYYGNAFAMLVIISWLNTLLVVQGIIITNLSSCHRSSPISPLAVGHHQSAKCIIVAMKGNTWRSKYIYREVNKF